MQQKVNDLTLGNRLAYGAIMAVIWTDDELENVHKQFEKQTVNWPALNLQTQARVRP